MAGGDLTNFSLQIMLLLAAVCFALAIAVPPVLPNAFNTTFTMTLPGASLSVKQDAFWSYDATQGGQLVWHPACPLGGSNGCSFIFTGGYSLPIIYAVTSARFGGEAKECCLLASGVVILPPTTFSKYAPVINTTILHLNRNLSMDVEMFFSQNRQCYVDSAGNLARVLDVNLVWDLPVMSSWNVGPQPAALFAFPPVCVEAKGCTTFQ